MGFFNRTRGKLRQSQSSGSSEGTKCSYCNHRACDKCKKEWNKGKKGYCCQCHRTNVMK